MIKFGFKEIPNKIDIFELGRIRIWMGARGQSLVYLIEEDTTTGHYIPNNLGYVHQLQNMCLTLTGEEIVTNE